MKKSLIALAALAAVGAASAQSSVTLYGIIDVGYGSKVTTSRDGTNTIRTRGVMEGTNSSTRIGFRGTEDLGGGLKANFVLEQGLLATNTVINARNGNSGQQVAGLAPSTNVLAGAGGGYQLDNNRQSYVGLSDAALGTFNIGYQYTVLYELSTLSGYNIGSEGGAGADKAHTAGAGGVGGTRANMMQYISPDFMGGFRVRAQYGAGAGREDYSSTVTGATGLTTDKARRMALMLQYANGPLSLAAAYTKYDVTQNNVNAVTGVQSPAAAALSTVGVAGTAGTATQTGLTRNANLFQVGGSYDFGVAKLAGTYTTGKNGGLATTPVGSPQGTPGYNYDYRAAQIGVSVPFGAIVPYVTIGRFYTNSSQPGGTGPTANAGATGRVEDYKQWQVGVRYSLSKRTTAYVLYGETRNDAAALNGLTATGASSSNAFYKDRNAVVGIQHNF